MSDPQQVDPDQSDPQPAEWLELPPERRRPRISMFVAGAAVLVALVLGGFGGYLINQARSGGGIGDSAAMGCTLAGRLDKQGGNPADWGLQDGRFWDAQAIGPLLHAAALRDDRYRELGETGDELFGSVSRLDLDQFGTNLDTIVRMCGRL